MRLSEISREYGIPLSTVTSAVADGRLPVELGSNPREIDTAGLQFQTWLSERQNQYRVKGESEIMRDLATFAAQHGIARRASRLNRYNVALPINVLFEILEHNPTKLDFAQGASVGEIADIVPCSLDVAQEYVSRFYALIGGNQADSNAVMRLLARRKLLVAAYLMLFREARPDRIEEDEDDE